MFALVASACGGDTEGTSTTAPPATTTSTAMTTTSRPTEVEIPETGILKLRPGTTYVASGFWEPVSFSVEEEGWWWSRGATELWVHIEYHEGGESPWDLDVSIVVQSPNSPIGAVVEEIVRLFAGSPDGTTSDPGRVMTEPSATAVGGFDAVVLDVAAPRDANADPPIPFGLSGYSRFAEGLSGVMFLEAENPSSLGATSDRQWAFGVRQESAARIWVVDVDGSTITIIAATRNEEFFDELIPAAETLLAGIEFP